MLFDIKMISIMPEKIKSIFDPKYRDFVASLVARRQSVHITQRELAKRLGVSHCYVARIETHERRIDLTESIAMMQVLGMSNDEIIEEIKKLL